MPDFLETFDTSAAAIDPGHLDALNASRRSDRETIAATLTAIGERHGASIERRDDPGNPGYHGQSIALHFALNGVGAMIDVDNLHGGAHALIHWYNSERPVRDFSPRFNRCVGEPPRRPHHKATSCPADWYSLAMFLDGGLMLAARGEAFLS